MKTYDAKEIRKFYDTNGRQAWLRYEKQSGDNGFDLYKKLLEQYIRPGDRVLEIGPGPGCYTQVLADIGARVVIVDISSVQLELNHQNARKLGFENSVIDWVQHDMCDMSTFIDGTFDAVVCLGPISYVLDQREAAMREMLRVLRRGGVAIVSVLSLWSALKEKSEKSSSETSAKEIEAIVGSGDVSPATYQNCAQPCHLFRPLEFREFLEKSGTEISAVFTSNGEFADQDRLLVDVSRRPDNWRQILRADEVNRKKTGSHLIAVVRKK
jgi:ubiquinone/menaquinone biosynthesis C-methylase UbiE